jgi:hypothetical protein
MEYRVILTRRNELGPFSHTVIGPVYTSEHWARKAGQKYLAEEGKVSDVLQVCALVTRLSNSIKIEESKNVEAP